MLGLVCELWLGVGEGGERKLKNNGKGGGGGEKKAGYAQVISLIAHSDTFQKVGKAAGKLLNDCHLSCRTDIKEF